MDFSWFGITVIDLGIVSIGIIGFAWLFRRIAILERENGRLQAEVDTLTKDNRDLLQELNILAARYTEIKEMLTLLLKRENFIE
ncbi:hypothetical protein F4167_13730 [Candidatus Poribacteria bacterium]|nr:hypothetical protein [Candidatus Poribacteria bacterium]